MAKNEFDNQMMAYYGIHYPIEIADDILAIAAANPKYRGLDSSDSEIEIGNQHVFCTTNSDRDVGASHGCIFIDEMTIDGDAEDDSEHTCVNLEPTEMIRSEEQNTIAVNFITDLYEIIIKEMKKKKMSLKELHLGWRVLACTFAFSESESDESDGAKKIITYEKAIAARKNAKQARKDAKPAQVKPADAKHAKPAEVKHAKPAHKH